MDEVARHVRRIARLNIGQLAEQLAEYGAQLGARNGCTQAEVESAAAQTQMRVGTAADVEAFGWSKASVSQLPDG